MSETQNETERETEPGTGEESEDNTQTDDAGVPGQIQYPDRTVYAERAAAFAAGKEPTLYPEDSQPSDYTPGFNPLYNDEGREPGDVTGEETEPAYYHTGEDPEETGNEPNSGV